MKVLKAAVALAWVLGSGAAMATTGNELSEQCQAFLKDPIPPSHYLAAGVCAGYVNGMVDGISLARSVSPERIAICFPQKNFTSLQAVKIVQRYLDTHPETLNEDAMILTSMAFKQAFPCQ